MIAFAGSPLDRAEALRRDEAALAALSDDPAARWVIFDQLKPVLLGDGGAGGIAWVEREAVADVGSSVLLGLDGGRPRFAAPGVAMASGVAVDARAAAMVAPASDLGIIAQARSLLDWHATHRFCANCGAVTGARRGGAVRRCLGCGAEHYPRVNPVAIMLVIDAAADAVLLGRGSRMPAGFYSALAGFMEPGETLEETVRREVMEEAGVRVGAVRYVASQPWPFPSNLMLGCHADALSTQVTIDPHEIEDARWFGQAEVVSAMAGGGAVRLPPRLAIAYTLIERWLEAGPPEPGPPAATKPLPGGAMLA